MNSNNALFVDYDLRNGLVNQERKMYEEIENIEANRPLNINVDELVTYFFEKYKVEAPQLDEKSIYTDQKEIKVDVSGDPNRFIFDRNVPAYISGTKVTFLYPSPGTASYFIASHQ